jgi:hypothetical protein
VQFAPLVLTTFGLLAAGATSAAQTPWNERASRSDVAAGIFMAAPRDVNLRPLCTELALPCGSPRTFPDFGLALQVAAYPIDHVALVGEASMYDNRWDTVTVNRVNSRDGLRYNRARALLLGPRLTTDLLHLTSQDTLGFRAFAQMLVGPEASTVISTRIAVQPGAGVDCRLKYPGAWVRVGVDYRSTRGGPRNLSTSRWMVALVAAP